MSNEPIHSSYKNAPISEFICGVIFQNNILSSIIHRLITELKKDYKHYQVLPAIFEEELQGVKVFQNMNYDAAGFTLYRLYSQERRIIVQLQNNLLLVNWVRQDDEKVGSYPGFHNIFSTFQSIYDRVVEMINEVRPELDLHSHIKSFTLHYQDRVIWKEYVESFASIDEIVNLQIPSIRGENGEFNPVNNIASKYTLPIEEIGGYAIITVSTGTDPRNKHLLVVECRMKGKSESKALNSWFEKAHNLQLNFFDDIFTERIRETWKL